MATLQATHNYSRFTGGYHPCLDVARSHKHRVCLSEVVNTDLSHCANKKPLHMCRFDKGSMRHQHQVSSVYLTKYGHWRDYQSAYRQHDSNRWNPTRCHHTKLEKNAHTQFRYSPRPNDLEIIKIDHVPKNYPWVVLVVSFWCFESPPRTLRTWESWCHEFEGWVV